MGGVVIVTEKLANGSVAWRENPIDLEERNSLAKVIRTADYRCARGTIRALKHYQDECSHIVSSSSYAHGVVSRCLQLSVDSALMQDEDQVESEQSTTDSVTTVEVRQDYSTKKHWLFREALQFNSRQQEF